VLDLLQRYIIPPTPQRGFVETDHRVQDLDSMIANAIVHGQVLPQECNDRTLLGMLTHGPQHWPQPGHR
jgi:hypothetical protein